ncbi:MAG: rhomboid family intramembrane serine protease [Henriciella sp.]
MSASAALAKGDVHDMTGDNPKARPIPVLNPHFPKVVLFLGLVITATSLLQFLVPENIEFEMMTSAALIHINDYHQDSRRLGKYLPYILHVFLHGGVIHLVLNMWALMVFGPPVARALGGSLRGRSLFLIFFFVCAIGGGIFQMVVFVWQNEYGAAIGASSALSGLLPAMGWLEGRWRAALRMALPWLLINIGLAVAELVIAFPIAWAAHIGGLAAGFMFPVFLALSRTGPGR